MLADVLDTASRETSDVLSDDISNALSASLDAGVHAKTSNSGIHQLQAKIMLSMMSIDQVGAQVFFKYWERHIRGQSGTQHSDFKTIAEYLPHRRISAGQK
jgi:hypothetical protein